MRQLSYFVESSFVDEALVQATLINTFLTDDVLKSQILSSIDYTSICEDLILLVSKLAPAGNISPKSLKLPVLDSSKMEAYGRNLSVNDTHSLAASGLVSEILFKIFPLTSYQFKVDYQLSIARLSIGWVHEAAENHSKNDDSWFYIENACKLFITFFKMIGSDLPLSDPIRPLADRFFSTTRPIVINLAKNSKYDNMESIHSTFVDVCILGLRLGFNSIEDSILRDLDMFGPSSNKSKSIYNQYFRLLRLLGGLSKKENSELYTLKFKKIMFNQENGEETPLILINHVSEYCLNVKNSLPELYSNFVDAKTLFDSRISVSSTSFYDLHKLEAFDKSFKRWFISIWVLVEVFEMFIQQVSGEHENVIEELSSLTEKTKIFDYVIAPISIILGCSDSHSVLKLFSYLDLNLQYVFEHGRTTKDLDVVNKLHVMALSQILFRILSLFPSQTRSYISDSRNEPSVKISQFYGSKSNQTSLKMGSLASQTSLNDLAIFISKYLSVHLVAKEMLFLNPEELQETFQKSKAVFANSSYSPESLGSDHQKTLSYECDILVEPSLWPQNVNSNQSEVLSLIKRLESHQQTNTSLDINVKVSGPLVNFVKNELASGANNSTVRSGLNVLSANLNQKGISSLNGSVLGNVDIRFDAGEYSVLVSLGITHSYPLFVNETNQYPLSISIEQGKHTVIFNEHGLYTRTGL
ncbi:hypothetical protein AYI68_g871 [Smittium mucronatum]|uniref:Uncharacterized protein n=1 Tax=Smittium mucronatum TaxID=133383 RepID=A0A1R0H6V9_9FUNG|nr:hypothetical protein AYI68_g871 [Smittium mucronatum]